MKKKLVILLAVMFSVCCLAACGNSETQQANNESSVTTESKEQTVTTPSGEESKESVEAHAKDAIEGDEAFTGAAEENNQVNDKLTDGTYAIEVESSSSMFKVEKAELTIAGEDMTAIITLGGTGYTKLFMGTGEQAAAATEADIISYVEDAEGAYTFTIPVAALDQPIDCAAFSKKKEEWYDRQLTFKAATVSTGAEAEDVQTTEPATEVKVEDGTYTIDVTLEGGSGRTTLESPAALKVVDGNAIATIQWSSSNYDYMLIDGEKYLPVNTEGNSTFEIPVKVYDEAFAVIGDTIAMSKPKEIEYTITFHSASIKAAE